MTRIIPIRERTDTELIQLHKKGELVFGSIYERYHLLVLGSCMKYLKNKSDAEDAVSDIFESISKKLKSHQVDHFKSWLYTVTRNHCIEKLRKENRHRDKKNQAEFVYSESIFHPDDIVDDEMIKKLNACLVQLPEKQHEAVKLFYFEKVKYKDIADRMDISWDKVRSFIQNARRNLKICIEK